MKISGDVSISGKAVEEEEISSIARNKEPITVNNESPGSLNNFAITKYFFLFHYAMLWTQL